MPLAEIDAPINAQVATIRAESVELFTTLLVVAAVVFAVVFLAVLAVAMQLAPTAAPGGCCKPPDVSLQGTASNRSANLDDPPRPTHRTKRGRRQRR